MRWHHVKIFNYEYALCPNEKEWIRYWKKIGRRTIPTYLNSDARCTFFQTVNDASSMPRALVTISDSKDIGPIEIVTVLAHEAVHIKQDMCEQIGEDKISSEMEAYIVQVVLQDLLYDYKDMRL